MTAADDPPSDGHPQERMIAGRGRVPSGSGLILALVVPVIPTCVTILNRLPANTHLGLAATWQFLDIALLIAFVRRSEAGDWVSLGVRRFAFADVIAVIGACLFWLTADGLITRVCVHRLPFTTVIQAIRPERSALTGLPGFAPYPNLASTAFLLTGAIMEELGSRAYLIERMRSRGIWFAGAASLGASVLMHIPAWGLDAFWRAPNLALLIILYIFRPSLIACSITHFIIDILIEYPGAVPPQVLLWRFRLEGLRPGFAGHAH